jgi:predicted RNA methylase
MHCPHFLNSPLSTSQIARTAVYSLNKSSTREFIEKKAKVFGFKGVVIAQMRVSLIFLVLELLSGY